jgi:hypothetical protein
MPRVTMAAPTEIATLMLAQSFSSRETPPIDETSLSPGANLSVKNVPSIS